jgi:Heparan-alpha-glucosaminide N-acetyltransferase, catalytic
MPAAGRALALDRFRIAAVLTMIQGHTFGALLTPGALGPALPPWYVLWHGLTAPMFLVGAGLAYGHVRVRGQRPGRRLLRPLWLVVLGFALQLPGGSLQAGLASEAARETSFALGPLSLIGLCLLGAELARVGLSAAQFRALGAALFAGLLVAAPAVWSVGASQVLPLVPGTWLDGGRGSTFPVFPWAAFFVAGVLLAPLLQRRAHVWLGGALGALVMGLAYGTWRLAAPASDAIAWHAGPLYVTFRLGACLVLLALAAALPSFPALGRLLMPFAHGSLLAYVTHLVLLYGSPWSAGLTRLIGRMELDEVLAPSLLVLVVTWLVCVLAGVRWSLNPAGSPKGAPLARTQAR